MARLLVVSDSHLSPRAPHADDQWTAIVAEAARRRPDLVVHAGDISLDGAVDADELGHARRRLDELPVRWLAIPGNHDIGDFGDTTEPIDDRRRGNYASAFGAGSWDTRLSGWHLVGVDVQTLASSLPAADELWSWLARTVTGVDPTALFIHRPLVPHRLDEHDDPRRYLTGTSRRRLVDLVDRCDVRLVVSGHVHQWRNVVSGRCRHVWVPSTWSSLPDTIQPWIGTKVTGAVEIELGAGVAVRLVRPPGVADLVGDVDFPSPFGDHD